jgi:hypothetical protein
MADWVRHAGMPSIPSDESIDSKLNAVEDGRCSSFPGKALFKVHINFQDGAVAHDCTL